MTIHERAVTLPQMIGACMGRSALLSALAELGVSPIGALHVIHTSVRLGLIRYVRRTDAYVPCS